MNKRTKFSLGYFLTFTVLIVLADYALFSQPTAEEISYSEFRTRVKNGDVQSVVMTPDRFYGLMKAKEGTSASGSKGPPSAEPQPKTTPWRLRLERLEAEHEDLLKRRFTVVPVTDEGLLQLLESHDVEFRQRVASSAFTNFFWNWIIPFAVLFLLWRFLMKRMGRGPGMLTLGKNRARLYHVEPEQRVSFKDVAGLDETIEEIKEVVDFLRHPAEYAKLGAKLPKGVLLVGPPGTGKTLLARAVAGEAQVPFFSLTGSDFVEMFVGVGAARVRDLFTEAKKVAPCIIFVDELDAVGRSRAGSAVVGSYDERENTLNQLLSEMDGFDPGIGIIIMGATNRPEILDAALLRPGRFDRRILVGLPDRRGRRDIFAIHVRTLSLSPDVDLDELAGLTPGLAGAEIANICNEAALLAKRKGHQVIDESDFMDAIERGIAGLEKKNKLINEHERRIIAYHESGHAIVGHFTPGADPVQKVSIVPRGFGTLGYTLQSPLEDRYLMSRTELLGKIQGLLGGRAAEELVFGDISTGGSDDLEKIAQIARDMITVYGMSRRSPNLSLGHPNQPRLLGNGDGAHAYSQKLESQIDDEIRETIAQCYAADQKLLQEKRRELDCLARRLLEKEKIDASELADVLGPRPGG